jgi:hypothetical protein
LQHTGTLGRINKSTLYKVNIINIHERELPVESERAAAVIDSLSSNKDKLWPRRIWPAMKFDRPLEKGATGGHGPIRYTVEHYEPGASVQFHFTEPKGFNGYHRFEILKNEHKTLILRHTLKMNVNGLARISWPFVYRPLHDALIEDSLATAQSSLGQKPDIVKWTVWVRFLRYLMSVGKARSQNGLLKV